MNNPIDFNKTIHLLKAKRMCECLKNQGLIYYIKGASTCTLNCTVD